MDPSDCRDAPPAELLRRFSGETIAEDHPSEPRAPGALIPAVEIRSRAVLTNQEKVFWPDEGYTKGDLCNYYGTIAPVLLPLLKDRPVVLVRHPDGIAGKSFFQWHVPRDTPEWIRTATFADEDGEAPKTVLLVDDVDCLLHIANLGCIPIHILASRDEELSTVDFVTIDLDLGEDGSFEDVITITLALKGLLDELQLRGFPKTSGQSGMHVLIPLGRGISRATAKMLVELIALLLLSRCADIATMEQRVNRREGRIFIDIGQVGRGRTIVAPYSVRAVPGARISTPLGWNEVHRALDPSRFTMFTVVEKVAREGDPMSSLLSIKPDIPHAVARLERLIKPR